MEVSGPFRPNDSLEDTLRSAMRQEGVGMFERMITLIRVRRLSSEGRKALEEELAKMVQSSADAGLLKVPVGAIVGGVVVGAWQDLFQWFLDNLPAILEAIMTIIALFG